MTGSLPFLSTLQEDPWDGWDFLECTHAVSLVTHETPILYNFFFVAFTNINLLYTLLNSLAYYLFSSSHRFGGLDFTQFSTLWYVDKECFLVRFHALPQSSSYSNILFTNSLNPTILQSLKLPSLCVYM